MVAKIEQFTTTLGDRAATPRDRLEALKFVVHFVGDIHQPLHASDNGDRGGNEIRVTFMDRRTNLHAVWDTGILAPAVNGDERAYARNLAQHITPAEIKTWRIGLPTD